MVAACCTVCDKRSAIYNIVPSPVMTRFPVDDSAFQLPPCNCHRVTATVNCRGSGGAALQMGRSWFPLASRKSGLCAVVAASPPLSYAHAEQGLDGGDGGWRSYKRYWTGERARGGWGEWAFSFVACLGHVTVEHAPLWRRSTVPTRQNFKLTGQLTRNINCEACAIL